MNARKTLAMAALLGIGLLLYYFEFLPREERVAPSEELSETLDDLPAPQRPFAGLELAKLQGVQLRVDGESATEVVRNEDGYFSVSGGQRASKVALRQLLDVLSELALQQVVAADGISKDELEDFGLQTPSMVLALTTEVSATELQFGKRHAVSKRDYARVGSAGAVFAIDPFYRDSIDTLRGQLVDTTLLGFQRADVAQLSIEVNGGAAFTLLRHDFAADDESQTVDNERWLLSANGLEEVADTPFIEKKLQELSELGQDEVTDVAHADTKADALVKLAILLQEPEAKKPRALRLTISRDVVNGAPSPGSFLLHLDEPKKTARVKGGWYKDFLQPPEHFKSRNPFSAVSGDISAASGEGSGKHARALSESDIRTLQSLTVLTYDRLEIAYACEARERELQFSLDKKPIKVCLAEAIAAADSASNRVDAPHYLYIAYDDGRALRAVIGAEEVKRLSELLGITNQ